MTVRFDTALPDLIHWLKLKSASFPQCELVLVRDLRGQIRLIANEPTERFWTHDFDAEVSSLLGHYKAKGQFLIYLGNDQGFKSFSAAPDAYHSDLLPTNWVILDRLVTGREWLYPENAPEHHPPRFVFFGLKGGVGRSTALSMVAWRLAQLGKKVLVIDLDLESPGLGNMLLPVRKDLREEGDTALPGWPDFGLTDWFVEDAVGQADVELIRAMTQPSPLNLGGRGEIIVVPAAGGLYAQDYISKLSRVYADFPADDGIAEVFGDRLARAISQLEEHVSPDVVLLDSRAGIHHISAAALTRLDAFSYLFASDSEQTWAGYSALFSHWAIKPMTIKRVRRSIRLVSALTPTSEDKKVFRDLFGEHSFDSFSQLYDSESSAENQPDSFSFGVFQDDAPHRPICVWSHRVYGGFEPLTFALQLDSENANQAFAELFKSIEADLQQESTV